MEKAQEINNKIETPDSLKDVSKEALMEAVSKANILAENGVSCGEVSLPRAPTVNNISKNQEATRAA
jgi:hypothetical protein